MVSIRVPLTQDKFARVSIQDVERVMSYSWCALKIGKKFYAVRNVYINGNGKPTMIYMHRFILDPEDGKEIDHEDLDGLNCTRTNMRPSTHAQNNQNKGLRSDSRSGYKGVGWCSPMKSWQARISCDKTLYHCGYFSNKEEAARAYDRKARELHGKYARTNFSD